MQARLDPRKAAPEAMRAMSNLHAYVGKCGLDHKLLELVKLRASQINSCAWCMDMHTKELRAAGESEQRLYLLGTWRECPFYSERERAALAWTEALTLLTEGNVPDDVFALAFAVEGAFLPSAKKIEPLLGFPGGAQLLGVHVHTPGAAVYL